MSEKNLPAVTKKISDENVLMIDLLANAIAQKVATVQICKTIPLADLYEQYMEIHVKQRCKTWRNFQSIYENYLIHWSSKPVADITRYDVETLMADLAERVGKTTANRVIQMLRAMINKGIEWDLVNCKNPVKNLPIYKLKARERFLEKDEIQRLFQAFDRLRYKTTRDFLYVCLYTGVRRGNVARMRWEEISFERKNWHIPETKNGESQNVGLTPHVMEILQERFANRTHSPWVFPSDRSKKGHLTKPDHAWQVSVARAGIKAARIHDLRRTLLSWEALTGANAFVIAETANHKDLKSTRIYARLNRSAVLDAMVTATEAMTGKKIQYKPEPKEKEKDSTTKAKFKLPKKKRTHEFRFGLGINERGEQIAVPEEVQILRDIFRMREIHLSLGEIANSLNAQGRLRRGRHWLKSHIDYILNKNPQYISKLLDDET